MTAAPRRSGAAGARSSSTSCAGCPASGTADLDGIVAMAETIARIGKEVTGRYAEVTASVSNFIPKPHTPYQWNGMQDARVFPLGPQVPAVAGQAPVGDGQGSRHRAEPARGDPDPRRPPGRRRGRGSLAARGQARRLDASTSTPGSGGTPSTTSASTSRSTASASGRSRKSFPGTISTSSTAAITWPRSRTGRSSSSKPWPEPFEPITRMRIPGVFPWQPMSRRSC